MFSQFKPAIIIFALLSVLTGLLYPALVTGFAQIAFPNQANGSLIYQHGQVIGSGLIGQQFTDPKYFWGRLSATGDHPYNASSSGGTNYGPLNTGLQKQVQDRLTALRSADPGNDLPVPADLVTASASGLDPHISIAAALYQAPRVSRVRGIPLEQVKALITQNTQGRTLGILGEPRVNVLKLNLALDALQ